ncbi:MAG: apolipoprotein N-acyltransferase [Crocinitomix sp. MedPE-SWsnd]|nr:MAG: apolipoprotein N-acyltransferase [Crocinitomix sp. MedPE-SWsnd]
MDLKVGILFLYAIVGGLILGVSFPFTGGVFPLAFVAFVPLLIANYQIDKAVKGKFFIRLGVNYLYFVIFNAITVWWIYNASPSGAYMAIFANALLMCLPFFFAGFVRKHLSEGKALLSLLVLWMAFEFCHFYWELSWPWLNLGHILGDSPKLMQWYEYSGVSGGTFWILLVNIFIFIIYRNIVFKKETFKIQTPNFIFVIGAIIVPVLSSLFIYYRYEEKPNPVNITIVQPNIEAHTAKFYLPAQIQLNKLIMAAEADISEDTDLILAPETAIPYPVKEDGLAISPEVLMLKNFLDTSGQIPMLIGADTYQIYEKKNSVASRPYGTEWYENYNTALMLKSNMPLELYHKSKLVLGGEKLPFVGMLPFLDEYSVELGGTSGMLGIGEEPVVFEAKGVFYAPLICYESVYGDFASMFVRKGATIITVITNDGWWGDTPGYKQHRMFSQIRAIENRRSVARSANTGISCFIDQRGEIISEMGWDEYGTIQGEINQNEEITFFSKYGDFLGRIACYLSLAMLLYAFVEKIKKTGAWNKMQPKSR